MLIRKVNIENDWEIGFLTVDEELTSHFFCQCLERDTVSLAIHHRFE